VEHSCRGADQKRLGTATARSGSIPFKIPGLNTGTALLVTVQEHRYRRRFQRSGGVLLEYDYLEYDYEGVVPRTIIDGVTFEVQRLI
jgi:hypothetical protein